MTEEERKALAEPFLQELHAAKRRAAVRSIHQEANKEAWPGINNIVADWFKDEGIVGVDKGLGYKVAVVPDSLLPKPKIQWQPGWFVL